MADIPVSFGEAEQLGQSALLTEDLYAPAPVHSRGRGEPCGLPDTKTTFESGVPLTEETHGSRRAAVLVPSIHRPRQPENPRPGFKKCGIHKEMELLASQPARLKCRSGKNISYPCWA